MKGWIIYNGALRTKKIVNLVEDLAERSKAFDLNLNLIKNSDLMVTFSGNGEERVFHTGGLSLPDYIIFWDKDILLARALERRGIRLFNSATAIENCDNKAKTFQKLSGVGIRMPKTILSPFVYYERNLDEKYYTYLEKELGYPMIVKEYHGSFGMQVYLAREEKELKDIVKTLSNKGFFFEEYIEESRGRDIRVVIVGSKVIGAMFRTNEEDFRANITIGGRGEVTTLSEEQKELALKAHKRLGLDFSGVDLLFGKDGEPILCEVNSNMNYLSYEAVSGVSVSDALLTYIRKEVYGK